MKNNSIYLPRPKRSSFGMSAPVSSQYCSYCANVTVYLPMRILKSQYRDKKQVANFFKVKKANLPMVN